MENSDLSPSSSKKFMDYISNWTKETSDIIIVVLFLFQMALSDYFPKIIVTIGISIVYLVWRRDNWLVSIFNFILFWISSDGSFDINARCFIFYCGSNICFYANKNTVATVFHLLYLFLFALSGNFGFSQYIEIFTVGFLSIFFPLFFIDVQNDLLSVHFFAPYLAATIIALSSVDDIDLKINIPSFIFSFLTSIKCYPEEYPTFHNTYNSRKVIVLFAALFASFLFEYSKGIGEKSYETCYDALNMIPMLLMLIASYLSFVFWNKEYSRKYRYGFTALHTIVAFVNAILLLCTAVCHITEEMYKLWQIPSVGNEKPLGVITTMLIVAFSLLCYAHDWSNEELIHRTIFAHFLALFADYSAVLISYILMNYFDMYRSCIVLRTAVALYTVYIAFGLLKESGSDLIINSSNKYKEMYDFIDEWAEVKYINVRDTGNKVVLEAKCQNRKRKTRVGVAANGLFSLAKKMGLDYTIEIIDAPAPKE